MTKIKLENKNIPSYGPAEKQGYRDGYRDGYRAGFKDGEEDGHEMGYEEGYTDAKMKNQTKGGQNEMD